MTPQEKAKELVEEIMKIQGIQYWQSQMCALIMADEIIKVAPENKSIIGTKFMTISEYYKEVKKEIENL